MYILAYMLTCKKKWFTNLDDYDGFAYSLACSTYQRMSNLTRGKIKSVLNYMKSIMRYRKVTYLKETFVEVIDPDYDKNWNGDLYTEKTISRMESGNRSHLTSIINDLIEKLPQTILKSIPSYYNGNRLQMKNIYTSVLLSLLYEYTLPETNQKFLERKEQESATFNNVEYYHKSLTSELIL